MAIRIVVVDSRRMVREGLCALLEKEADMEVVGQAEDGATAIRLVRELVPDVVILDVGISGISGVDVTRRIIKEQPGAKIIATSMNMKKIFVDEMLKAGAVGYVLKERAFALMVVAIKTTMAGEVFLCPKAAGVILDSYIQDNLRSNDPTKVVLSNRERETLKLLAEGKPSKEIAMLSDISVKTVDACRRRIMQKLGVQSIAELVKYAIREGLTSLDT